MKNNEIDTCDECGQLLIYDDGWKCQCPPPDDDDFWEDDYNPDLDPQ